jgi:hypothetical protein
MAEHADHATGRHVAITRATIAERIGCDVRTVTAAWRVLRAAEWAVEAQRGHGSPGTPSAGRRPSVYHLISRRRVSDFHLPPSGGSNSLPPVRTHSPSAHPRPHKNLSTKPTRHWCTTPRPLPVQRLAAQLVARSHGLGQGHIGGICDTITAAGIELGEWRTGAHTCEPLSSHWGLSGRRFPTSRNGNNRSRRRPGIRLRVGAGVGDRAGDRGGGAIQIWRNQARARLRGARRPGCACQYRRRRSHRGSAHYCVCPLLAVWRSGFVSSAPHPPRRLDCVL